MGCISGVFYPNEDYTKIRDVIRTYSEHCALGFQENRDEYQLVWSQVEALALVVKPEDGAPFDPVGGVCLLDYTEELEDETARELSVLGLPAAIFIEHFRDAHDAYYKP